MRSDTYACTVALIGTLVVALIMGIAHFALGMSVGGGCLLVLGVWFLLAIVSQLLLYRTGDSFYTQGTNRLNRQDYEGAVASFTKYLRRRPQSFEGYYYRGLARYYAGNLHSAIVDLDESVRLRPQDEGKTSRWVSSSTQRPGTCACYFMRGLAHLALGHVDEASQDFEMAHELASPHDDKALLGLVAARHAQGQVEEAASLWQALLARDRRFSDLDWVERFARRDHPRADPLLEEVRKLAARLPAVSEDQDKLDQIN